MQLRDERTRVRSRRIADKNEALRLLREAIKSDKEVHKLYPFETKILELSHIGYEHRANS